MSDAGYKNLAIAFLAIAATILFVVNNGKDGINLQTFVGLAILAGIAFLFPFVGFLISIPILLVVWFDHFPKILEAWNGLKNVKVGGKE